MLVLQNSADFKKDDWLKIHYFHTDGFKSYRGEMFCPLCFKKLTPHLRLDNCLVGIWTELKVMLRIFILNKKMLEKVKISFMFFVL